MKDELTEIWEDLEKARAVWVEALHKHNQLVEMKRQANDELRQAKEAMDLAMMGFVRNFPEPDTVLLWEGDVGD